VLESALGDAMEDALNTLCQHIMEFEAVIVQATLGNKRNDYRWFDAKIIF
jgi:hypothetical protein